MESKKKLSERLKERFKLQLLDASSFEDKFTLVASRINLILILVGIVIFLFIIFYFTIAYTPLKSLIPGYTGRGGSADIEAVDQKNLERLAELETTVKQQEIWINNTKQILKGELLVTDLTIDSISKKLDSVDYQNIDFVKTKEDSVLKQKVKEDEQFSISTLTQKQLKGVFFFTPVKGGKMTDEFNPKKGHYGIDIIAPKDEPILASLDGTVVFSSWTPEDGKVIQIQHKDDIITMYKHNSVLLKEVGAKVQAGTPIAVIGNTGNNSEGPHLHFEVWKNGAPVNPKHLISLSE